MTTTTTEPPLPVVIVGSGLAGYTVARELRKLDKGLPLVGVSRDHAGFYSKPMLSNALAGGKTAATLVMKPAPKMAEELAATLRAQAEVRAIDAAARTGVNPSAAFHSSGRVECGTCVPLSPARLMSRRTRPHHARQITTAQGKRDICRALQNAGTMKDRVNSCRA